MPAATNRQVVLQSRPTGIPQAEHFAIVETAPEAQARVRDFLEGRAAKVKAD